MRKVVDRVWSDKDRPAIYVYVPGAAPAHVSESAALELHGRRNAGARFSVTLVGENEKFISVSADRANDLDRAVCYLCEEVHAAMRDRSRGSAPSPHQVSPPAEPDATKAEQILKEYMKREEAYENKEAKLLVLVTEDIATQLRDGGSALCTRWSEESGAKIEVLDRKPASTDLTFVRLFGRPRQLWKAQWLLYERVKKAGGKLIVEVVVPPNSVDAIKDLSDRLSRFSGATVTLAVTASSDGSNRLAIIRIEGTLEQCTLAERRLADLVDNL